MDSSSDMVKNYNSSKSNTSAVKDGDGGGPDDIDIEDPARLMEAVEVGRTRLRERTTTPLGTPRASVTATLLVMVAVPVSPR